MKLIFFIVIIGFSMIQAMIKAANEKAQAKQRQVNVGDRKARVQSEIESFLEEVTGGASRKDKAAEEAARAEERRERRRQQAAAKKRQQQQEQRRKQQQPISSKSAGGPREVGSNISGHVEQYINQHVTEYIDNDVEEYVEATIVDSVEENLGARDVEMPRSVRKPKESAAASVVALLRNPEGVRDAIVVNEILSPPRALRK